MPAILAEKPFSGKEKKYFKKAFPKKKKPLLPLRERKRVN